MKRRYKKILLWLPKSLVIIVLFAIAFLFFDFLQIWLGGRIASYLSSKLNTKVEINSLNFDVFGNVNLAGVTFYDKENDTLLYFTGLSARLADLSFKKHYVFFSSAEVTDPFFYVRRDTDGTVNLTELLRELYSADTVKDTMSDGFKVYVSAIRVNDGRFRYEDLKNREKDKKGKINFSNLYMKKIDAKFNNFKVDDNIDFEIEHLSFKGKSGFSVRHIFSEFSYNTHRFKLINTKVITNSSYISLDSLIFTSKEDEVFSGITDKTFWRVYFNHTAISLKDINFLAPGTFGNTSPFLLTGYVYGYLSDLHFRNLSIEWSRLSQMYISGNITGLPDINNTLFYLNIRDFKTDKTELEEFLSGIASDTVFTLPSIFDKAGVFTYKGNLSGFYNDFVTYGFLKTDFGLIKTDLRLKHNGHLNLDGEIGTVNFNMGSYFDLPDTLLGLLTMEGNVKGTVDTSGNFKFDLAANVDKVGILNHNYRNIAIDGVLNNTSFDGEVNVKDTALRMVFWGQVDFSDKNTVFDFTADVKKAVVPIIYPYANTKIDSVSLLLKSRVKGDNLKTFDGDLELYQVAIHSWGKNFKINSFIVSANDGNKGEKKLNFNSPVLSGILDFKASDFKDVRDLITKTIANYYTFVSLPDKKLDTTVYLSANFSLVNPEVLNYFFLPFNIAPNSKLNLYAGMNDSVNFSFETDSISFGTTRLLDASLFVKPLSKGVDVGLKASKIYASGFYLDSILFDADLYRDTANFEMSWNTIIDSSVYAGDLQAQAVIADTHRVICDFIPSYFIIADTMWYVNDWNCEVNDTNIIIKNFVLNHENEYVWLNGIMSGKKTDSLKVEIEGIDLKHFNSFFEKSGYLAKGYVSGDINSAGILSTPIVESNLEVNNFVFDKEKFGKLKINTSWIDSTKKLQADIYLLRSKLKTLELNGYYDTKTNGLDFTLNFRRLLLRHFQPFLDGVLSKFRGLAEGDINIKGTLNHPLMEGVVDLKKVSFMVDYLKTAYSFTAPMYVNYKGLFLRNIDVYDSEGDKAKVDFSFTHKDFKDFSYNINVSSPNLIYMNTTEKDNPLYFGKVYGGGNVSVTGNFGEISIKGNVTTQKKTKFNLALESPEDAEEYGFVTFVSEKQLKDTVNILKNKTKSITGVDVDLKLKATDDALVRIIFNSKSGDIIRANGKGDLNIRLTKLGDLIIKGDYIIEHGSYLFTLQNMINKKFEIKKGSYIKWNGDPYKAYLNITAVYKVKTSLYELTLDSNDRKNVYVECLLNITNRLDEPNIKFGIDIKSNNTRAKTILANMSQDEISKQMIMLMVLGRFYTPEKFRQTNDVYAESGQGNALGMNASELLSEQLSYWLSQITKDFDVGVKYIPGNELSKSELEVALSTQMFNDKVIVNGNVNMGGNVPTSSGVAGDVSVELKLNPKGTIRLKGFNKTNDDLLIYQDSPYTQGMGIFYTESFNSISGLLKKYSSGLWSKIYKANENIIRKIKKKNQ